MFRSFLFVLFFGMTLKCHALFLPSITYQYLSKEKILERKTSWVEYYHHGINYLKLGKRNEFKFMANRPERKESLDVALKKLSGWFEVDLGKINQGSYFDKFSSYNSDDVLARSCFTHDFVLPCPKKSLGSFLKLILRPNLYLSLGWGDPNGCKGKVGHDTPFHLKEYFRMIEAGYQDKDLGRYYIVAWNQDALKKKKKPAGYGMITHVERKFGAWVPFLRCSYVNGHCFDLKGSVSLGLGYEAPFSRKKDYLGLAGTWGRPWKNEWKDQTTFETYYRYQLTSKSSVTPHLQFNYHPYKYQENKAETAFGVRLDSKF